MCLGLVELALGHEALLGLGLQQARRDRELLGSPGAGEGETELNRLFYRLGWTKGWYKGALRNKVFGELAGEATPDLKAIKAKLLEIGPQVRRRRTPGRRLRPTPAPHAPRRGVFLWGMALANASRQAPHGAERLRATVIAGTGRDAAHAACCGTSTRRLPEC